VGRRIRLDSKFQIGNIALVEVGARNRRSVSRNTSHCVANLPDIFVQEFVYPEGRGSQGGVVKGSFGKTLADAEVSFVENKPR
jgi:hypothetical protein